MAQYVMKSEVKKVMHFVDCDSAKWQQYSKSARVPMSLIYAREFKLLRRYEAEIVQNSNLILVVSEAEKKEFAKFVSTDKFIVVTSGVDTDFFPSSVTTRQKNLVFTGVMDYFANVDAVLYFCKEILPLIKEEHSDIKFFIVGRNPTAAVRSLGTIKGVFVTGYVQDIREYLHKAVVSIVLLRIAQGVQNKILESMASGLPVVTTSKAALSLRAQPGRDILIADTPEDFSNKVSMLLKDNSLRRRIGESARKYVEENHN
jgi:sugar transferase (PEP-CTERM/EpsH1 system associated)